MASDKITEIVDQSAFAQVDKLKLDLKALTDQFVQLFGGVEQFKKALATASTGGGLSGGIGKVTSQMTELEKATKALVIAEERLAIIDHDIVQKKREVQLELKKEEQARKEATKAMQAEEGSYNQMEAALKKLTLQYKAMGTANMQAFGKDKLAEIQKYEAALQSLDKGMGKFNRNVGNYQNQTFQLSQVFREIPAFTYSATTGILALSNNLPMLADGFKQVSTATNDATGKVNGTMGALKIFAKSIFSWTNAFTIAIGLITIFSKEITNFISNIGKANKAMNDLNEARLKGAKDAVAEKETLASLYRASTDMKRSIDERAAATNELQKLYPQTFKDFTAEDIALGKAKKGYDELGKSIESVARVKAIESRITEIVSDGLDKQLDLERQLKEARLYKYTNEGKKQEFKIQGKEDRIVEDTDKTRAQAVQDAQNRLLDFKMEQEKKLKILRDAIDKEKVIVQDSPVMGGGSKGGGGSKAKDEKETDRVKNLEDDLERRRKVVEADYKNGISSYLDYNLQLLAIAKEFAIAKSKIQNLTKKESESEADFNLRVADAYADGVKGLTDIGNGAVKKYSEDNKQIVKDASKAITDLSKLAIMEIGNGVYTLTESLKADKVTLEDILEVIGDSADIISQLERIIGDVTEAQLERDMVALDVKEKRLKEYYDNQMRYIEQSGMADKSKEDSKRRLEADTEAKRKQIDRDRISAMRKQAKIQKAIDIAEIIANTAKSVTALLKTPPLALLAAAQGAAALYRVIATPLPQYAEGTDYHKGGSFIAGEKGVEQVILPSGKSFLTPDSATLFPDMPQGTKVINNKDLMQQIYNSAIVKLSTQGQVTPQKMMEAQMMAFEEMTDEVKGLRHDLRAKELTATFQDYAGFRNYKNSNIR